MNWALLQSLPKLLHADGQSFVLWRDGTLFGKPVTLDADIITAGAALTSPEALLDPICDVLTWSPIAPMCAD